MAKNNLILEIGIEEVPARFLETVLESLASRLRVLLEENRLSFERLLSTGTMKRLVIYVEGLDARQKDIISEIKGPPKNISFGPDGSYSKAAAGFAAAQKVAPEDLFTKNINGTDYLFAKKSERGVSSKKVLKELLPKAILSAHLPISMKWQDAEVPFIRPIHYIMAVLDAITVPFSVGSINSSNKTKGHRFLSDGKPKVYKGSTDIREYSKFLKSLGVILYHDERKGMIADQIKMHESSTKEKVFCDDNLLLEVANITENPVVLKGSFDRQFIMVLPQDVINTVVKKQQKCFPVKDSGNFLIVADGKSEKEIVSGYEQVVNARLCDAKFFYDEDIKVPLDRNLEKMKKIVYHEKIGSMWDKTQRIIELSGWMASLVTDNKETAVFIERAAELCKADLTTHMVGEFSGLAGVMGREYSLVAGEDIRVGRAIYEHYLPKYAGDELPTETAGAVIGIADRIDSIVSCFAADIIPTGSVDPYGLRRAAMGIVAIMLGKNIEIPLTKLVDKSMEILGVKEPSVKVKVLDFIKQRLKVVLEGESVRYDIADSVLEAGDEIVSIYCKAFEIVKVVKDDWLKSVILQADRISRIVGGSKASVPDTGLFSDEEEKALYKTYSQMKDIINDHILKKEYEKALFDYRTMTKPVETFFEKVLVMHQDEKIRANRIALLSQLKGLYLKYADFSKIVV